MATTALTAARRVMGVLHENKVALILGTRHVTRYTKDGFDIIEIMKAVDDHNSNPTDTSFDNISRLVDPVATNLQEVFGMEDIFQTDGSDYFLVGTRVPLPVGLVKMILRMKENGLEYTSLVNFWNLCLINPNVKAREQFFLYCEKFGVTITPAGYAVLYKAVRTKTGGSDNGFAEFVATEATRIRSQKKGLGRFQVYRDLEGNLGSTAGSIPDLAEDLGNLSDLHKNIDTLKGAPVYTSQHPSDIEYRLGEVAWIERNVGHDPQLCGPGVLHVGHHSYVKSFAQHDSVILTCLVDPSKVMALPTYDSKLGVAEFFPTGIMERTPSGDWEEIESPYFEDDYIDYEADFVKMLASQAVSVEAPETLQLEAKAASFRLESVYANR